MLLQTNKQATKKWGKKEKRKKLWSGKEQQNKIESLIKIFYGKIYFPNKKNLEAQICYLRSIAYFYFCFSFFDGFWYFNTLAKMGDKKDVLRICFKSSWLRNHEVEVEVKCVWTRIHLLKYFFIWSTNLVLESWKLLI